VASQVAGTTPGIIECAEVEGCISSVAISPDRLLLLVGNLNDHAGDNAPRDRFRRLLEDSVPSLGTVREYVDVCLRKKEDRYV